MSQETKSELNNELKSEQGRQAANEKPLKKPAKRIIIKPGLTKPKAEAKAETKAPEVTAGQGRIALILVRGLTGTKTTIRDALYMLRLRKKHVCVVIPDTPANRAAAIKCKDYITFGEINNATYDELVAKRGKKDNKGELKKFFSLHPPRGGFERKGIKMPLSKGGALGYRGAKINDLIKRML